jgi:hypothetical protein
LQGEIAELKRQQTELKNRREWRWGSALLNAATLGRRRRRGE